MKRTELTRRTRLEPGGPIARRVGLRAKSAPKKQRIKSAVPAGVRTRIDERSGGWCEMMLRFCIGRASQVHHRITVKAGGRRGEAKTRHDRLSNCVHACSMCHLDVTGDPKLAYESGLSLREYQDPALNPVLIRGQLVYLTDDGSVVSYQAVGA